MATPALVLWTEPVSDNVLLSGLSDGTFVLRTRLTDRRIYLTGPELAALRRLCGTVLDDLTVGGARPLPWEVDA